MAYIRKRTSKATGKTTYSVEIDLKGYPKQQATFKRKTDATRWANTTEAAILEGRHFQTAEAKKHTLAETIDLYNKEVKPAKSREYQLKWWRDQLGEYRLFDITNSKIAACKRELMNTHVKKNNVERTNLLSDATVNRYLAALSHVFTYAINEWSWCESNPVFKVSRLPEPRGRTRFLSDDEVIDGVLIKGEKIRLLEVCRESHNPYLYIIVMLAISTGMRSDEIMSLQWQHVDLKQGQITLFKTKNGEIRVVPLTGPAFKLVKGMTQGIGKTLLFPSKRNPEKPTSIRNQFAKALTDADIEDFKFHDLRHTAASYLAMNGASLHEIAEILGHKTLAMVQRYAHLTKKHTSGVVASMNERIFGDE